MIVVGELSLWIALVMAAWGAIAGYAGGAMRRGDLALSAERSVYALLFFVTLAAVGLCDALIRSDFSIEYVALYTSDNVPALYKISAFWAGAAGASLLWALLLASFAAIVTRAHRRQHRAPAPHVIGTLCAVTLAVMVVCVAANPYGRVGSLPADGQGLDPFLQSAATALRAPMLYLGYAATAIPFACGVSALITRRLDVESLATMRRWSLLSWIALTIGISLDMWWTSRRLAGAALWTSDPIESVPLLPWLVIAAFLHAPLALKKRGTLRPWSAALVIVTFALAVAGALIERHAPISSVRYQSTSTLGWPSAVAMVAIVISLITVVGYATSMRLGPDEDEAESRLDFELRRRGRWGACVAYAGIALVAIAAVGLTFGRERAITLRASESAAVRDPFGHAWAFTSEGISQYDELNRHTTAVLLRTTRDGVSMPAIETESRQYFNSLQQDVFPPSARAGVLNGVRESVYVVLVDARGETAQIRVSFAPLMTCAWLGALLAVLGGVIAVWPTGEPHPPATAPEGAP